MVISEVNHMIKKLTDQLVQSQQPEGRWSFCFEGGVMPDAYMILLMEWMGDKDVALKDALVDRLLFKRTTDGYWRAYEDEKDGNLSSTIEASVALLYAGALNVWGNKKNSIGMRNCFFQS